MPRTMAESATRLTYADYLQLPYDGKRYELIDGNLFVDGEPDELSPEERRALLAGDGFVTPATLRHQRVVANLHFELRSFVEPRNLGRVYFAPLDVRLSDSDVIEPDLLVIRSSGAPLRGDYVDGAPDLAVEVLSPSTRRQDEVRKRDLFERSGVPEYWIVDLDAETVKVYRREAGSYGRPTLLLLRDGDAVRSPQFPGLEVPLAAIFAE